MLSSAPFDQETKPTTKRCTVPIGNVAPTETGKYTVFPWYVVGGGAGGTPPLAYCSAATLRPVAHWARAETSKTGPRKVRGPNDCLTAKNGPCESWPPLAFWRSAGQQITER